MNQASALKFRHSVKPLENGKQFRAVGVSVICFTDASVTGKSLHIYGNFWTSIAGDTRQCI